MENHRPQRPNNDQGASEKNYEKRDRQDRQDRDDKGSFADKRGPRRPFRLNQDRRDSRPPRDGQDRKPRFEKDGDRPRRPEYADGPRGPRKPRPNFGDGDRKPRFARDGQRPMRDGDREQRPRFENRGDRPRFEDRDRRPRFEDRGDRPRFENRGDRPRFEDRGDRPRFENRDQRPRFEDKERRPRFEDRGDRPRFENRDQRPRFEDKERRPRFEDRGDRPRFENRDQRPRFEDKERRPRFEDRGDRPRFENRDQRPRFEDKDRRPRFEDRGDRPRFENRDQRPRFEDKERRPRFEDRGDRPRFENRGDRPRFEDRDRRPRFENRDDAPRFRDGEQPVADTNFNENTAPNQGYTEFGYAYSNTTQEHANARVDMDQTQGEGSTSSPAPRDGEQSQDRPAYGDRPYGGDRPFNNRGFGDRGFGRDRDGDRGFGRDRGGDRKRPMKRPPLRETIMDMDKDLLKMLARRCNILDRMRSKAGQMAPKEEKELRASWEKAATQMTRDPRIIHQLFAMMQEIVFSAKPQEGAAKRTGFNLAPPQLPVDITFFAPLASRRSRFFLALAGASGSACTMTPSLLDDATIECIKMFNQCATSLAWDDKGTLIARQGGGLSLPDKVIYVGDDILNFFLLLGHYVSKNTRAKFTGEASLKEADLTAVRSFLPQLGARLSNVMPSGAGFPIRLECSGIFEDRISIPADIPADMVLGLFLAAPFWDQAISFEMRARNDAEAIIEEALSVLEPCQAQVRREGSLIHFVPCPIKTPAEPELGMDLHLASYLLALPLTMGGKVQLKGLWPDCTPAKDIKTLLAHFGLEVSQDGEGICTSLAPMEPIKWRAMPKATAYAITEEILPDLVVVEEVTDEDQEVLDAEQAVDMNDVVEATEEASTEAADETVENSDVDQSQAEEAPAEEIVETVQDSEVTETTEQENADDSEDAYEDEAEDDLPMEELTVPYLALYEDARFAPLMAACAYLAAVRRKQVTLPSQAPLHEMESFFNHLGFVYGEEEDAHCTLVASEEFRDPSAVWTAPTPAWAMAYAVCAAARPHIKLSNPGIMGTLYPQFWTLYNALPSFDIKKNVTENANDKPVRRRIIAADQEGIGSGDSNDRSPA